MSNPEFLFRVPKGKASGLIVSAQTQSDDVVACVRNVNKKLLEETRENIHN